MDDDSVNGQRATKSSWQRLVPPLAREPLGFAAHFSAAEAARMGMGFVPRAMEDKWFVYLEAGWLNFHRSWTGAHVYALRLEASAAGWDVVESWGNRDREQYAWTDTAYDRQLVRFLVDALLLGMRDVEFPVRAARAAGPLEPRDFFGRCP